MLSVVLPTIDEAENLRALVPALLEVDGVGEIWIVDDGSTDGTPDVVRALARADPRVHLIERRGTPCLTDSIEAGIHAATGEHVAWMDADGSMSAADLARLHRALIEHGDDIVVGSRFHALGRIKGQSGPGLAGRLRALVSLGDTKDPWYGVLLSWGLNGLVLPALLGDGVHDYTSGFVVASRRVVLEVGLRGDHGEYFIDFWVRSRRMGHRVREIGYAIGPRRSGRSKTAESPVGYLRRGRRYVATAWRLRRET